MAAGARVVDRIPRPARPWGEASAGYPVSQPQAVRESLSDRPWTGQDFSGLRAVAREAVGLSRRVVVHCAVRRLSDLPVYLYALDRAPDLRTRRRLRCLVHLARVPGAQNGSAACHVRQTQRTEVARTRCRRV